MVKDSQNRLPDVAKILLRTTTYFLTDPRATKKANCNSNKRADNAWDSDTLARAD
jgi:hypothetical protein